ncbi:MAG: hypothetical protein MJ137_07680, partial [Clostridia bacterium]|nr:hypothetical protein [Clostridia bacterium]
KEMKKDRQHNNSKYTPEYKKEICQLVVSTGSYGGVSRRRNGKVLSLSKAGGAPDALMTMDVP